MKKRTEVVAGLLIVYTGMCFALSLLTAAGMKWEILSQALPWGIQLPFWIALVLKRRWAWNVLVATESILLVVGIWYIARIPGYYLSHPSLLPSLPGIMAFNIIWFALSVILPLAILLTDRPSGWQEATASTEVEA